MPKIFSLFVAILTFLIAIENSIALDCYVGENYMKKVDCGNWDGVGCLVSIIYFNWYLGLINKLIFVLKRKYKRK